MKIDYVDEKMPEGWPQNGREASLSNVNMYFEKFMKEPNFHNKEMLLALINQDDLNESNDLGVLRTTDYEVGLINSIYLYSKYTGCNDGVLYIYRLLIRSFLMRKIYFMMVDREHYNFEYIMENDPYIEGLIPELKYFYFIYGMFRWEKSRSFAECLINNMLEIYDVVSDNEANEYFRMFNIIIYDLSFNNSIYMLEIAKFSREEIMEVFKVQAMYSNRLIINPLDGPLKGVLCISVANWLLKSRNDYNQDVIYKCMWSKDMISASKNMQLWMKKTKYLNDENEGCISTKILSTISKWRKYDWMVNNNYSYGTSYISSFCKIKPNEYMLDNYGDSWIGFKNDKIASSIAPINISAHKGYPFFCQVFAFDVCYDENEFKQEINLVASIVENFNLLINEKQELFNKIIHYWRYSIKEDGWSCEKERRYQIFLFDDYEYIDLELDEKFLKVKTYLTMCPDFCNITNYCKYIIKENKERKMKIYTRPFYYCEYCFYHSFDESSYDKNEKKKCPICNSNDYYERNN